jgi:hypothetical protein
MIRPRSADMPQPADTGSVTLFLVITVVGLLAMVGLCVDGAAKIRDVQRADTLAAEAGRAGGQAIDVPASIVGKPPVVDARAAVAAAQAYLARNGVAGSVAIIDGGRALDVEVTSSSRTVFLGLIGIDSMTVHGHATVTLVRGVTGAGA